MHRQDGVGLVVSAAEHAYIVSRLEARISAMDTELRELKSAKDVGGVGGGSE